jgi:hypothetical protein
MVNKHDFLNTPHYHTRRFASTQPFSRSERRPNKGIEQVIFLISIESGIINAEINNFEKHACKEATDTVVLTEEGSGTTNCNASDLGG